MTPNVGTGGTQGLTPSASIPVPTVDQRLRLVSVGLDDSIDGDHLEASPSTGAEQVARVNHAVYGLGDPEPEATIENDDYLKDFFGVSS